MSICPICREPPSRPAVLSCGHVACRSCLRIDITGHTQCAVCRSNATIAVDNLYYSFDDDAPQLPKCDASAVLASVLRHISQGRVEAAVRPWRTFVIYATLKDPAFSSLVVRGSPLWVPTRDQGLFGMAPNPCVAFAPGQPLHDLNAMVDWIGRFVGEYPTEHQDPTTPYASPRMRWLHLARDAVQSYGVGVDIWRAAGVEKLMLDALGFRVGLEENDKEEGDDDSDESDAAKSSSVEPMEGPSERDETEDERGEGEVREAERPPTTPPPGSGAARELEYAARARESLQDLRSAGLLER